MPQSVNASLPEPEEIETLAAAWDQLLYTIGSPVPENPLAHAQDTNTATVPVTVLSGFLGAGKTTLLCNLLRTCNENIIAIVNDLASVNIDAALVKSTTAETLELENGCACCVLGNDLDEILTKIGGRETLPDAIVIEASGISDPMGFAQTIANNRQTTLNGIVTIVEAPGLHDLLRDETTAALLKRQLSAAHIILLSKTESGDDINEISSALSKLTPGRPILAINETTPDSLQEIVLSASLKGARPDPVSSQHDYDGFASMVVESQQPANADDFFALMDRLPASIYRIKGVVNLEGSNGQENYELQTTGPRWRVEARSGDTHLTELVIIGQSDNSDFEQFISELRQLLKPPERKSNTDLLHRFF